METALRDRLAHFRQWPRKIGRRAWFALPQRVRATRPMRRLGTLIYERHVCHTDRRQSHFTHFMRNPPLLTLLAELAARRRDDGLFRIVSFGCSTGAELYSLLYVLRLALPDLPVEAAGTDICESVLAIARRGVYRPDVAAASGGRFDAGLAEITARESRLLDDMFERRADGSLLVRAGLRRRARWMTADIRSPRIVERVGRRDLVMANNVLGPTEDGEAAAALGNIARLVTPGGYLVLDGVDLGVKTDTLLDLAFEPVVERQAEIWSADPSKRGWPWYRWAREPLDRSRPDWRYRYSLVFRAPQS